MAQPDAEVSSGCGDTLYDQLNKVPLVWSPTCDLAFRRLKLMLAAAPVVQPPDWTKMFHVFVDASDVAIGSVLMQEATTKWF